MYVLDVSLNLQQRYLCVKIGMRLGFSPKCQLLNSFDLNSSLILDQVLQSRLGIRGTVGADGIDKIVIMNHVQEQDLHLVLMPIQAL